MNTRTLSAAVLALSALAPLGVLSASARADDSAIMLQGKGPKRDAVSALQYKPFDVKLLDQLKSYTGGPALTAEALKGKPLLIVAWSSWLKSSHSGLAVAQAAADKYAPMGLEVVAVHHTRGFENAKKAFEENKFTARAAHDEKGEFFKTLLVGGGGPDYYLVDRAGNLRFAQVDRKSVEAAVEKLVKETPDEAAKAQAPSSSDAGAGGKPGSPGDWKQPPASEYSAAKWPAVNKTVEYAKNVQGKPLPVKLGKETWITDKPTLDGRVIVLDFWATWCGPCIAASPKLDELQGKFKDDLVIVGLSGQKRPGRPEDVSAIKSYLDKKPAKYSHANDTSQAIYKALDIQAIPHVVVMSTDGTVRWQGNPHEPAFAAAVEDTIKNDPGIKARAGKK